MRGCNSLCQLHEYALQTAESATFIWESTNGHYLLVIITTCRYMPINAPMDSFGGISSCRHLTDRGLCCCLEQVAPYNTYYPKLEAHLAQVGVDATLNRWDRILTLGTVDLQDTLIHPPGAADTQVEGALHLPPEKFMIFTVCIHQETRNFCAFSAGLSAMICAIRLHSQIGSLFTHANYLRSK